MPPFHWHKRINHWLQHNKWYCLFGSTEKLENMTALVGKIDHLLDAVEHHILEHITLRYEDPASNALAQFAPAG